MGKFILSEKTSPITRRKSLLVFCLFIVYLLFLNFRPVLAYDFLGLNPKMEENVQGSHEKINWDPKFLAEMEAVQATILRQISVYESYWVDRQVNGVEVVVDDSWLGRLFKNKKNVFSLSDQLMPKSNKCANTDSDKLAIMSETSDITQETNEVRDGKKVQVYHEFTATITGFGWNCEGKSGEAFWADDEDLKTGKVIPKEDSIKRYAVDDEYIEEYKKRTKDVKHPSFDPEAKEDFLFDGANGQYFVQLQKARDYLIDNCTCKLKGEKEEGR